MKSLQTIGVVGAGTTGRGSAQVCAMSGVSVSTLDCTQRAVRVLSCETSLAAQL